MVVTIFNHMLDLEGLTWWPLMDWWEGNFIWLQFISWARCKLSHISIYFNHNWGQVHIKKNCTACITIHEFIFYTYCTILIDSARGVTCDTAVAFRHSDHLQCDLWQTDFSTNFDRFFPWKGTMTLEFFFWIISHMRPKTMWCVTLTKIRARPQALWHVTGRIDRNGTVIHKNMFVHDISLAV